METVGSPVDIPVVVTEAGSPIVYHPPPLGVYVINGDRGLFLPSSKDVQLNDGKSLIS